jgi:uncharacterized protein YceK
MLKAKGRKVMTRRTTGALLLLTIWLLTGCAAVIVGTGAGVGTYTYLKGDLKRSYHVKFDKILDVCTSVLKDLNQPILKKTTDGEKTTIETERKNGSPQTITVSISSVDWTEVSVRTGVFGYWNKEVSQQFHEFVAERLNK